MTNAPNPNHEPTPNSENQPQPTPRHRPRRRGRNILLGLGVVLLVSFGVGVGFAWFFIQRQLAPMVEKNLARLLNRPVNLGQVESFTYNGLRFGASEVPATPTDPDHASMPAIDVAFNPFKLLLTRTLEFDITLIDPEVYLEQSQDGRWLDTRIQQQEKGFIDVKLQEIQVHSADVVLVPRSQNGARLLKPVAIALPNGGAQFLNNNQLIQFNLQGNLLSGGQFRLQGTSRPAQEQTKLAVSGNDLKAPEISRLLRLPLNLHAGEVAGNLEINITEDEPLQLFGTTTLENVTARTAQLPQPFVNTNGLLRFKGTLIGLEDVKSRFGQIPAVANGVLDTQSNYNIVARSQPVTIKQVLQTFKIQETPVPISGEVQAAIQLVGPLNKPIVRGEFVTTKPTQVDRVTFRNISSGFGVVDSTLTVNNLRAVPTFGGLVTANGRIGLDEQRPIAFNVQATNLPGTALARNYNVNLPVPVGLISARTQIVGSVNNAQNIRATGIAQANVAGGTVTVTNVQIAQQRFRAQVQAQRVELASLPQIPPRFQGLLSGDFIVGGSLANFSPATLSGTGSANLNIAGGTVSASNIQLNNGRFRAQVQANNVQLSRVADVPPALQSPISASFNLAGSLTNFSTSTLSGTGVARLNVAGGTVTASNVQLNEGRFRAQVQANSVQVGRLAQVPPQFQSPLSGSFNLAGSLTDFSLAAIQGSGSGRLNVAGGTVAATAQIANGRFSAVVEPTGVQLASFSQDLRGRLAGRLNLSGSLTGFSPSTIQAQGQLNFSEGLAIIDRPLTADIRWNGERLEIARATAQGFDASGVVDVNLASRGVQAIEAFNLNVQAQDLDLQQLPATLPIDVAIAGRADFNGRISGTQNAPNVNGNLQLENFVIEGLAFEPVLSGNVSAVPGQGVNVQLAGTTDQIQVALDPNYQPISFLIQRDESVARGTRQGELLLVNAQDFPIGIIKEFAPLPPAIAAQPLSGRLSGDVTVNLNNRGISGEIAIANPIFGTLRGESFIATLDYTDGNIVLSGGEFIQGESRYLLSGAVNRTAQGPQFQGQLEVNQGQLQDVLVALQLFDLDDLRRGFNTPVYGEKQDVLPVAPVGLPEEPLQTQLRRLSEIDALLAQQRQQEEDASPLPPLSEASGTFTGTLSIVGSLSSGITAEFDIRGQDWEWDQYNAEQVVAEGSFQNGVLTLLPLRFQSGESFASFSGSIGSEEQSGQLQLRNIPVEQIQVALQDATNVPPALVGLTGRLNATATLSGSLANPQARGEVEVLDAMLNQEQVQSAQGSFSYTNARLNFSSTVLVTETDPLNISGSIPYKLPVATVEPENNELTLNIDVQNEGLALLNFFSQGQVSWIDGTGNVKLSISGTYDQDLQRPARLVTEGVAEVQNATIAARALPEGEPLTNVNGRILFDFDQIQVEQLQAQFSDGSITASGTLPISQPAPQENPLSVNIGELAFNLKGLYNGRVAGDVQITGTALAPVIGGEVNLFNGNVFLAESTGAADGTVTASTGEAQMGDRTVAFDDLQLILGRNIEITRPPIISFLADGTLTINGSLGNLRPEGTIRLKRGQVNLFTTQFRLARGYEQTARFTPGQGLDPILDVRLVASVAESSQGRLPTDPLSAEISDAPTLGFGTVQTVRVEARVEGPASQLANNLELTSSPSRSQTEIVALLGGSFVDTLGRGDSTLGLVNLAGSALLSNVQNVIGDALGLSEFRLYPTTITNEERRTSTLGLAAEAGVDLSQSFSVSVSKELTTDQPFRYGLRYRLNDQILLRGDTDLSGDSRAVVEYENRF